MAFSKAEGVGRRVSQGYACYVQLDKPPSELASPSHFHRLDLAFEKPASPTLLSSRFLTTQI